MKNREENWKPMFEGSKYYISDMGRVKGPRGMVKGMANVKTGLWQCMVYIDSKPKLLNVGQWVAKLFLGEPPEGCVARHKSKNLKDNRVENLYWGKNGTIHKPVKFRYIIRQKTIHGLVIATFVGFKNLESQGFKKASIVAAAHGKYRGNTDVYKSFRWEVIRMINKDEGYGYDV